MENTNENDFLYHYTSIEKLALILKNQTIRLNPLDTMDDLQEGRTSDVKNLGKFIFVSSWTSDSTESIPMWKMYTEPTSGVRIKLRKNPFIRHGTYGGDIEKALKIPAQDEKSRTTQADTFLDISELIRGNYFSAQAWGGNILTRVIYTDDIEKLEPKVLSVDGSGTSLSTQPLGMYKNTHWSFQNEWRYKMMFIPMSFQGSMDKMSEHFAGTMMKMISGQCTPPFSYYDLDIAPHCFSEMEITISPQMTAGNRILLESLIEKFNPNAKVLESSLYGLI